LQCDAGGSISISGGCSLHLVKNQVRSFC